MKGGLSEAEVVNFYIELGSNIRRLRKLNGLNQQEFGVFFGLSRTSIVNIEKGNQRPTPHLIFSICKKFSTNIDTLFPKPFSELVRKSMLVTSEDDRKAIDALQDTLQKKVS